MVTGEEAADIGLVEHAVPQNDKSDAAYEKALEIAKEIAGKVCVCLSSICITACHVSVTVLYNCKLLL